MAEILSVRSRAEERMRENARRATARLMEERREEERQRREREAQERREQRQKNQSIVTSDEVFPLEEGELSEITRFQRGEPISDEVPGGYLAAPSLRGDYPAVPLPSERMLSEYRAFRETPEARLLPSTKVGAALGAISNAPARAATEMRTELRSRPREAEIFETIVGSGREMYGNIPEPPDARGGFTRRGSLGKKPHPTFNREYQRAYNDYSEQAREGTLFPRNVDVREYENQLSEMEERLLGAFDARARGFGQLFGRSPIGAGGRSVPQSRGNPFGQRIPAEEYLRAYEEGNVEQFNEFVGALARIQALRQAMGDVRQVSGIQSKEELEGLSRDVGRAQRRAAERRGLANE